MLKVGLTGGIGSGKSTVARIFETLGIPVYYADQEAKKIMRQNPEVIAAIRDQFGPGAYDLKGNLDRAFLAKVVFEDKEKLARLNAIVHPATIQDSNRWAERQTSPYILKEAALLFESEAFHHVDKVIGVFAPVTLRLHRTMKRDQISKEAVENRMKNQMNEEVKMRLCDFVIQNDEQQALIPQVLRIHAQLTA